MSHNDSPALLLHPDDNVAYVRRTIPTGSQFRVSRYEITAKELVEQGHKIALSAIAPRQAVRRYGQVIGYATEAIQPGEWVHRHNMEPGELTLDYAISSEVPADPLPIHGRTFQGYRRADGRAATRNYIGIVSTVNCSAATSKMIAERFNKELLRDFPNIDGVVPLVHKGGCAFDYDGSEHRLLARTLAGFCRHPNIGAYLIVGLGCETSQGAYLQDKVGLVQLRVPGEPESARPLVINMQEQGGIAKTVRYASGVLKDMLPDANNVRREPIPVSEIILGTNCGGSDGNSGVTSNPALGIASDMLVAHGGTSILAETPEIYGAEHLLTRRARTREVGEKLLERVRWWEDYCRKFDVTIDNNPSVGNKKGGLTTIYEKSLGAIAKAGHTALNAVYEYAEPVTAKGFVFMDTPGFDPVSVTGLVAGGANVVVFTTGRGSCFGCKPAPSIKVASNTPMYERMVDDMDINAGGILEGGSVEEIGKQIFEKILSVASGEKTKSEAQGIGDEEFAPWIIGPIL
ncbi:MAG TPA: altronate dehydratase family protein [Planctomycetaceae bacterium]|nr:altronate dehydratase family protein [Planctomycetaceae bacterium]